MPVGSIALLNAAPANADCTPTGSIVFGFTGPQNRTSDVYANNQRVGSVTTDSDPSGGGRGYGYFIIPGGLGPHVVDIRDPANPGRPLLQQTQNCSPPTGSDATAGNNPNGGVAGDPVSTSIGEYYFQKPLLDLGGPLPLRFTLNYGASMEKSSAAFNDPFGGDFTHSLHIALYRWNTVTAVVSLGNGNTVRFERESARLSPWRVVEEEIGYQLIEDFPGGNLIRYHVLDPVSELVYRFEQPREEARHEGFLTRIEDRNGNALVFTNDAQGRVTRVEDGLGRALTFTYANQRLTQVADQSGRIVKFDYKDNLLSTVTDAMSATTMFTYTGPVTYPVLAAKRLPRGNVPYAENYSRTQFTIQEPVVQSKAVTTIGGTPRATVEGWRVETQTDAFGNATRLGFDDKGVTTITDPLGNTSQQAHKDGKRLSAIKDATGKTATFEYDANGRRTTITDRMGDTTKIAYHAPSGKIASITNARGDTISFTYAPQEQAIGPDKIPFTFYLLARVDYPDQTSEQFTYDAAGNALTRVDRAGQPWKYTYNARGQALTVTNPTGGIVTYTYNADATLASRKDADTGETKYAYDALKRLNKITRLENPALSGVEGSAAQIAYDANDRIVSVTDENNNTTRFEYDANGNLVKVTDAAGQTGSLSYDAMDRIIKTTNRVGQVVNLSYDALGRLAARTNAAGVKTEYAYDPRGWFNSITRAGATWKIGYDDEGTATSIATPSGNTATGKRDQLGMLVGGTDALGNTTTLTRDALNRVTGVIDALNRATNYAYDPRGALAGVTMPVVGATKYERDAMGNLTKISDLVLIR